MDKSLKAKVRSRKTRLLRVRKKLKGSAERPRLSVSKTNQHIYAQLIDDQSSITLAGIGTQSKEIAGKRKSKEAAREIGTKIAGIAKSKNIESVIFDRGRNQFHGIIAELANGAREAGLKF